jgi:hypothetical protein
MGIFGLPYKHWGCRHNICATNSVVLDRSITAARCICNVSRIGVKTAGYWDKG